MNNNSSGGVQPYQFTDMERDIISQFETFMATMPLEQEERIELPTQIAPFSAAERDDDEYYYQYAGMDRKGLALLDPCCAFCGKTNDEIAAQGGRVLMKCTRCERAYYCGAACQKKDYKQHKKSCREIAGRLADCQFSCGQQHSRFYDEATKRAMKERYLCCCIENAHAQYQAFIKSKYKVKAFLEKATQEVQELLLEDHATDFFPHVKQYFPFLMLLLNRDKKVFNFCYHWIHYDAEVCEIKFGHLRPESVKQEIAEKERQSTTKRLPSFITIHEGMGNAAKEDRWTEWIYPMTKAIYDDPLEGMPEHWQEYGINLPAHMLAVCIIKMKLIAAHDVCMEAWQVAYNTSPLMSRRLLPPLQTAIQEFLCGEQISASADDSSDEAPVALVWPADVCRDHVSNCLRVIHRNNNVLLPSLRYPDEFRTYREYKTDEHAPRPSLQLIETILDYGAHELWYDVPGAAWLLESIITEPPERYFVVSEVDRQDYAERMIRER